MTNSVSLITVNYNAGDCLVACVSSALSQVDELIVVDNASTDVSLAQLEAVIPGDRMFQIIRNRENIGFAAGCNIGIKAATKPYLLFLNPDCVLGVASLQRMVAALRSDERAGMAGGLLINPDGTEQGGGRRAVPTPWRSLVRAFGLYRFADRWPRLFYDFHLHKQPLPGISIEVEAISGACMLVKREAMEDVGLLDEGYFLHCEDLDWSMRFRQKHWRILFVPDAPVVHHCGTCSRDCPIFVEWHKHKGMMRFYHKFFRNQYPGALMWLVALGIWLRFGLVSAHHLALRILRHHGVRHG